MAEPRFTPPLPPRPARSPKGLALLRALRTNVLDLWPDEAYEADAMTFDILFGRKLILLNAPEAVRHVLVENEQNYLRSPIRVRVIRPIVGEGLLLSEGEQWRRQRRTFAPAFSPRAMPPMLPHFAAVADQGIARLRGQIEQPVNLYDHVHRWSIEIAARTMLSLDLAGYLDEIVAHIDSYVPRLTRLRRLDVLLPKGIPSPTDFLRRRFSQSWMGLIERMLEARLQAPLRASPEDILDLLLAARDPETGEGFSRRQLRDQVATMMVAGQEPSSLILFWTVFLLASAPAVQARVAEEVNGVDLDGENLTEAVARLDYLKAVINEVLRLYPPVYHLLRYAKERDHIIGIDIARGQTVVVAPMVLHRHHRFWTHPEAFDPDRFLPGAPPPTRFSYIPFGGGPRVCAGAVFAQNELVLVIAKLVQAFELERVSNEPVLPICSATTRPDHHPMFRLRPRQRAPKRTSMPAVSQASGCPYHYAAASADGSNLSIASPTDSSPTP